MPDAPRTQAGLVVVPPSKKSVKNSLELQSYPIRPWIFDESLARKRVKFIS
jgi:hypothetical protein